ncbi:MAG: beta-ketoacyl synthase N-terminal-like domain-containing protein [Nannocystaceae bacterium]
MTDANPEAHCLDRGNDLADNLSGYLSEMGAPYQLLHWGAQTPLGRSPASSSAAFWTGMARMEEHPIFVDQTGEPAVTCRAPWLGGEVFGAQRFERLLLPAIEQALSSASYEAGPATRLGIFLALPEHRPGRPKDLEARLSAALDKSLTFRGRIVGHQLLALGHAGGFEALHQALEALVAGKLDMALVGGVDSYDEPETLEWLEAADQLHGFDNPWGFVPGEASACVVISKANGVGAVTELLAVATTTENKLIKSGEVCVGRGLSEAWGGALRCLPDTSKVDMVLCDLNGEPYRSDEYGFTSTRFSGCIESASDFESCADRWGDVGAASGALLMMVAAHRRQPRSIEGFCRYLISVSSEGGTRGAALLNCKMPSFVGC